jgi:hypothetical protein
MAPWGVVQGQDSWPHGKLSRARIHGTMGSCQGAGFMVPWRVVKGQDSWRHGELSRSRIHGTMGSCQKLLQAQVMGRNLRMPWGEG